MYIYTYGSRNIYLEKKFSLEEYLVKAKPMNSYLLGLFILCQKSKYLFRLHVRGTPK